MVSSAFTYRDTTNPQGLGGDAVGWRTAL